MTDSESTSTSGQALDGSDPGVVAMATGGGGIRPAMVWLLAVACGLSVANLYYAQPLLDTIASTFDTSAGTAGLIVTLAQVGYAVGLALVVPLGDLLDRRRLVPAVLLLSAGALAVSGFAPGIGVLIALAAVIGLGSVAAQLLVPFAAELASDAERGRVVGQVMSGLLLGILLARTVSGAIAGLADWRAVYWVASVVAVGLSLVLLRFLPSDGRRTSVAYLTLLAETVRLMRTESLLRRRALLGALGFAAFSAFWTTLAFLLSAAPFDYGDAMIGLFGLIGAAGALAATSAGRLADRGWTALTTAACSAMVLVSFAVLWVGRTSVVAVIVGILVLDVGVQGLQVTNQSLIYTLAPEARSRITSAYMVCYFIGGALGSAVGGALFQAGGWGAVCALGAGLGVAALVVSLLDRVRPVVASAQPG